MATASRSRLNPVAARERLIVALDVDSAESALELVDELGDEVVFYKVGLELFCSGSGIGVVQKLVDRGCRVFADFKLYDVPATVQRATRQLNGLGIEFLTVHGDVPIMQAAVQAAQDFKILAVTVLTSMSQHDVSSLGFEGNIDDLVKARADGARQCGCAGVIASGREAAALKEAFGTELLVVTPGVRNAGDRAFDQKRTVGVVEAFNCGADYIVMGRPIRDAGNPAQAANAVQTQIARIFDND